MAKKICMEHINKECVNKSITGAIKTALNGLECPHCMREDGKNGFGDIITEEAKAVKVFEILKDKVTE